MIKLIEVYKKYHIKNNEIQAINGINLDFSTSGLVFITGKSGSGKSTLLNLIGGLDVFDSGEIEIDETKMSLFKPCDYDLYRNEKIGFIFQEYNLFEEQSVSENLALSLSLQGRKATAFAIEEALEKVDLLNYADRKVNTLSGGQKQRVAVARAIIKKPAVIMADEPTGALDSDTGEQLFETLKKLSNDRLVLVVSHDTDAAQKYADRIIKLKDGKIEDDSTSLDLNISARDTILTPVSKKNKLPFINALKMGFAAFLSKPIRLLVAVLLSAVAFSAFAVVDAAVSYDKIDIAYRSLNENINYLSFGKEIKQNYGKDNYWKKSALTEADLYELKSYNKDLSLHGVISLDYATLNHYLGNINITEIRYYAADIIGAVSFTQEEIEESGFNLIGDLPQDNGEIAISYYMFELFSAAGFNDLESVIEIDVPEDLIGKTIEINTGNVSFIKEFTITGIVNTNLNSEHFERLKDIGPNTQLTREDQNLISELTNLLSSGFHSLIFVSSNFIDLVKPDNNFIAATTFAEVTAHIQNHSITLGQSDNNAFVFSYVGEISDIDDSCVVWKDNHPREFLSTNQILINFTSLSAFPAEGGGNLLDKIFSDVSNEPDFGESEYYDIVQRIINNYKEEIFSDSKGYLVLEYYNYTKNISVIGKDASVFEIVGICYGESVAVYGSVLINSLELKNAVTDLTAGVFLYAAAIMPPSAEVLKNAVKFSYLEHNNNRYRLNNPVSEMLYDAEETLDITAKVLLYVALGIIAFATVILFNYISVSIINKKKDIGILRAMGAKGLDVFKIFFIESIIICLVSFLLAVVLSFAAATMLNSILKNQFSLYISLFSIGIRQLGLLLLISMAVAFSAAFIPIYKMARKKPIDVIQK